MNDLVLSDRAAEWRRLKSLVVDSVSSPITRRVYNLGLDEFFAWYGQEPRPGFTKATASAWRVFLEGRGRPAAASDTRRKSLEQLSPIMGRTGTQRRAREEAAGGRSNIWRSSPPAAAFKRLSRSTSKP